MTLIRSFLSNEDYEQSSGNTSTTPLGSGATFTGTGELNGWSDVMVVCKTDNTGTLYFDFSPDGSNWDSTFPVQGFQIASGINEFHTAVKGPRYFRVRLVNDTGAQTYLRLYTYYGTFRQGNLPLNQSIAVDADAQVVRPTDFHYEVAQGRYSGATTWNKFGYNNDIDTATDPETIWSVGGSFVRMTSADTLDVVSSSGSDTGAGTGAQSVIIYGIDANFEAQTEVVTLSGVTPVTTLNTWLGVNRVAIYLAGTGGVNAGTITIDDTAGTVGTQAEIPVGEGTTQQCIFFVEANHTALMDWMVLNINKISGGSTPTVTIRGWVTSLVSGAKYLVFKHTVDTAVENTVSFNPEQPFVVGEKSMFELTGETDTNNTVVNARFSLIEVQNV